METPKKEKKSRSLSAKVFRMFLAGTIVLCLILQVIVLGLYSFAVANQYIATSYNLSRSASRVLQSVGDVEPLYNEVMGRYRAMTEAERAEVDSEAYEARFADITEREDYKAIRTMLGYFLESSDLYDIYFAMYDRDTAALVYIADPSEEDVALPGYWEEIEAGELNKFLGWNGEGMLYDVSHHNRNWNLFSEDHQDNSHLRCKLQALPLPHLIVPYNASTFHAISSKLFMKSASTVVFHPIFFHESVLRSLLSS